jgi:2-amino-4-hydroxy-6-hydroxymethyldihydropteridine diphosphokinase
MPLSRAYLALGSNLGDRCAQMQAALDRLSTAHGVCVVRASPIYENRAIGMQGEDFLNAVVEVTTHLQPEALLDACLSVESSLGRVRGDKWAPRTIDLDLLLYDAVELQTERLTLPHPRLVERDFVAQPLLDIAPQLRVQGQLLEAWVAALPEVALRPYTEVLLVGAS